MKRCLILVLICFTVLFAACLALAKDKEGPVTGTWNCTAKGGPEGVTPFTLTLQQNGDSVDGSVTADQGATNINGSFTHGTLEIHINTDNGNYILTAKLEKGALSGTWAHNENKGTWEGKKQAAGSQ